MLANHVHQSTNDGHIPISHANQSTSRANQSNGHVDQSGSLPINRMAILTNRAAVSFSQLIRQRDYGAPLDSKGGPMNAPGRHILTAG
jgi:hypothetical protein